MAGDPRVEGPGEVGVADPVDVAEVDEDQVGVVLVDHRQRRVHRREIGGVAADGDDRRRLPAVGRPLAEDAVEVLLAQHRPGREAGHVEPLDDRLRAQVGGLVERAGLAEPAVVDHVGRHAAAVGPHAGHHHHVVGDGLHHRHRVGLRVVEPAGAQRGQRGGQGRRDLLGLAAVDDHDVRALAALRRRGDPARQQHGGEDRAGAAGEERTPTDAHARAHRAPPTGLSAGSIRLVPDLVTQEASHRTVASGSARSLMTNQSIWARSGVRSRTE